MSDGQKLAPQEQEDMGPEMRNTFADGEIWWVVVDFIAVWTESSDPAMYWRNLKRRADPELKAFMDEALRKFPFKAGDGRMHPIDTATEESLLRLVQSVPSKNAEKIKRLLAQWGAEKIQELREAQVPSPIEIKRDEYRKQGYPDDWIETRIAELLARNELTDTWKERGAKNEHYPVLTNTLTEGTFGFTVRFYLSYKSLPPKANLQDNMTPSELALSVLSKETAKQLHENRDSQGLAELHRDVTEAGQVTGQARQLIEQATGQSIVSPLNAKDIRKLPEKKGKRKKELPAPPPQPLPQQQQQKLF